ncbi:MAG: 1-deoxy-D-xylulose-5-phosphate reductoisomerase [bacterium]
MKNTIEKSKKKLIVLGSTGSVGAAALDTAAGMPDIVEIVGLAAYGNLRDLEKQIERFAPKLVCVADAKTAKRFRPAARAAGFKLYEGDSGLAALAAADGADTVFNAIVGVAGLKPTLAALEAGRSVLMANKESIVAGGDLINKTAKNNRARLIPVDSEHSAIFQCLQGRRRPEIKRVILTASGGPFLRSKNLKSPSPEQALAHPRWLMGPKVSVDSATLMNKGLEMIEASRLFSLRPDQVTLVIHPESVVHSLVELSDGSMIAQLAAPDMKIPIAYSLSYPNRRHSAFTAPLSLSEIGRLTFEEPDMKRFPCLSLALSALSRGGLAPAVLNAADEAAVAAFLARRLDFAGIHAVIAATLEQLDDTLDGDATVLENILIADASARRTTAKFVKQRGN